MAVKFTLDKVVAWGLFHRPWYPLSYVLPFGVPMDITKLTRSDAEFVGAMLVLAIPFAWVGVATTAKRLRTLGLPLWLVVLFFIPLMNAIFFLLIAALPDSAGQPRVSTRSGIQAFLDRNMPTSNFGNALLAVTVVAVIGVGLTALSTLVFRQYGWGVFVALPFLQGVLAAGFVGYRTVRPLATCVVVALLSVALTVILLVAVSVEGAICIAMALPIAAAFAVIGAIIGYLIQRTRPTATAYVMLLATLLTAPATMAAQSIEKPIPSLTEVQTSVIADAPPTVVWKHVVAFPKLPPPKELIFQLGVAYPQSARIAGHGVGSIRYCVFSTGPFIEPITVWDEPRLLRFSVVHNPAPMRELSPYGSLDTPHIHGYLDSRRGQFELIPISGNRTLLRGSTWYRDDLWPQAYWRVWSDAIIHRIHLRVLNHIKTVSEVRPYRTTSW